LLKDAAAELEDLQLDRLRQRPLIRGGNLKHVRVVTEFVKRVAGSR
jgi:hypothetical protein